jgi:Icc-related predicted phosphoesterase
MKIVLISDTHNREIALPEGDLLIHAGDATMMGTIEEIIKLNTWLESVKLKFKHGIIFSPGNHDWLFETNENLARTLLPAARVLINQEVIIEGVKIYCSPVQPEFCAWAFNKKRGEEIRKYWNAIPEDTKVLVTHGPPAGILDLCPSGERVGCSDLIHRIQYVKPEIHMFGHIHHSYGIMNFNGTTFVNASICDERYLPNNKPVVIEL